MFFKACATTHGTGTNHPLHPLEFLFIFIPLLHQPSYTVVCFRIVVSLRNHHIFIIFLRWKFSFSHKFTEMYTCVFVCLSNWKHARTDLSTLSFYSDIVPILAADGSFHKLLHWIGDKAFLLDVEGASGRLHALLVRLPQVRSSRPKHGHFCIPHGSTNACTHHTVLNLHRDTS